MKAFDGHFKVNLTTWNGKVVEILAKDSRCFLNKSKICDCSSENDCFEGFADLNTDNLPIRVASSLLTLKSVNSRLENQMFSKPTVCPSTYNQLTSTAKEIVDYNLNTCLNLFLNPIAINLTKPYDSFLYVNIWIRDEKKQPSCENIWICSSNFSCTEQSALTNCKFVEGFNSHYLHGAKCTYLCSQNFIHKFTIFHLGEIVANRLEICEMSFNPITVKYMT